MRNKGGRREIQRDFGRRCTCRKTRAKQALRGVLRGAGEILRCMNVRGEREHPRHDYGEEDRRGTLLHSQGKVHGALAAGSWRSGLYRRKHDLCQRARLAGSRFRQKEPVDRQLRGVPPPVGQAEASIPVDVPGFGPNFLVTEMASSIGVMQGCSRRQLNGSLRHTAPSNVAL